MRNMKWQLGILGTISAFAFRHRETKKNLCRECMRNIWLINLDIHKLIKLKYLQNHERQNQYSLIDLFSFRLPRRDTICF